MDKLNREVIKIMQEPEVKKQLALDAPMMPAQVAAFFESENAAGDQLQKKTKQQKTEIDFS